MLRNLDNFDPMAIIVAKVRVVHQTVVLEFDAVSHRTDAAQNRQTDKESYRPKFLTWIISRTSAVERP